jgi:hypothetical protein
MKTLLWLCTGFLLSVSSWLPALAQPTCPAAVLLDLSRAASACYGLEREQACIGGEAVVASGFNNAALPFNQVGDRAAIDDLETLLLTPVADAVAVVSLTLQANLTDVEARQATLLLVGEVTLTNEIQPQPEVTAFAQATANLRAEPRPDGDILARVGVTESVIVTGRTRDGNWLRARLRDSNAIAWVAAEVVTGDGLNRLPVVEPGVPVYRPFEQITLQTGDASYCEGALPAGLLVQSPGLDTPVRLNINDAWVEMAGTFFIRATGGLMIDALAGQAVVGETAIPAGAQGVVEGLAVTVAGYDPAGLASLPLTNLPTFVRPAAPLTAPQIATIQADYTAALAAQAAPTPAPAPVVDNACRRFLRRDASLYAGPGDFYEVINGLQSGAAVTPIFQTTDPDGAVWYQLRGSNWLPASMVVEAGACQPIPVTTNVQAPGSNELSLETCQTTNGPLRAGQQVRIVFTPPPFQTYVDARDARRIDPGRITIGSQGYWPRATQPVLIAGTIGEDDERWLVQFYILWEAVPGTFRIEGDRVSYTPICTITVPVS